MNTIRYLAERGKESGSYAGIAAILAVVGFNVDPGLWQAIVGAATGACGLAAVLLKDRGAA